MISSDAVAETLKTGRGPSGNAAAQTVQAPACTQSLSSAVKMEFRHPCRYC